MTRETSFCVKHGGQRLRSLAIHWGCVVGLSLCITLGTMNGAAAKAAGAVVPDASVGDVPTEVALKFENPLDLQFVKLQVFDDKGRDHGVGPPMISSDRRTLSVHIASLTPGKFVVQWGVVDRDGNMSKGSFTFVLRPPQTLARALQIVCGS